jgi:hypothetical protein
MGFVDGNFTCEFSTLLKPNQEQLPKMHPLVLWQESALHINLYLRLPLVKMPASANVSDITLKAPP